MTTCFSCLFEIVLLTKRYKNKSGVITKNIWLLNWVTFCWSDCIRELVWMCSCMLWMHISAVLRFCGASETFFFSYSRYNMHFICIFHFWGPLRVGGPDGTYSLNYQSSRRWGICIVRKREEKTVRSFCRLFECNRHISFGIEKGRENIHLIKACICTGWTTKKWTKFQFLRV